MTGTYMTEADQVDATMAIINSHLTHDGYPERLLSLRQNPQLTAVCDLIANGLRVYGPSASERLKQQHKPLRTTLYCC